MSLVATAQLSSGPETRITNDAAPPSGGDQLTATTYVGGFGGYWGSTWGATYDPGYMRETTTVTAETSIYDLKASKLIWAGRSETVDPKSVPDLVAGIADAATAELVKEGLVAQAPEP